MAYMAESATRVHKAFPPRKKKLTNSHLKLIQTHYTHTHVRKTTHRHNIKHILHTLKTSRRHTHIRQNKPHTLTPHKHIPYTYHTHKQANSIIIHILKTFLPHTIFQKYFYHTHTHNTPHIHSNLLLFV